MQKNVERVSKKRIKGSAPHHRNLEWRPSVHSPSGASGGILGDEGEPLTVLRRGDPSSGLWLAREDETSLFIIS